MASACHCAVFLILLVAGLCNATNYDILDFEMARKHELWMAEYGRVYKDEAEKAWRFEVFKKNVKYIEDFNNAGKHRYTLGVSPFTDLTPEEFRAKYTGGFKAPEAVVKEHSFSSFKHETMGQVNYTSLPTSLDWRDMGAVTSVKFQINCGCCWALSSAAAVEGLTKIKKGVLCDLSAQQLVDCDHGDCTGGYVHEAFEYIIQNKGLTTASNYPYKDAQGNCSLTKASKTVATIGGYKRVLPSTEKALMMAVAKQPVVVGINASDHFQHYKSGVFHGSCGTQVDHAVLVVGYGETGSDKYWLVKNSWSARWGEGGYVRMEKDTGARTGLCAIASQPYYPTL